MATNNQYNKKHTQISRKLRSYVEILFFMLSPHVFRSLLLCTNCFYKHSTVLFHTIASRCRDFNKYADFFLYNLVKFICGISYSKRNVNRAAIVYSTCTMLFESTKKTESRSFEQIRTFFDTPRLIFGSTRVAELRTSFFESWESGNWQKNNRSSGKSMTHLPFVETVFLICCLVVHCTPRRLPQNW